MQRQGSQGCGSKQCEVHVCWPVGHSSSCVPEWEKSSSSSMYFSCSLMSEPGPLGCTIDLGLHHGTSSELLTVAFDHFSLITTRTYPTPPPPHPQRSSATPFLWWSVHPEMIFPLGKAGKQELFESIGWESDFLAFNPECLLIILCKWQATYACTGTSVWSFIQTVQFKKKIYPKEIKSASSGDNQLVHKASDDVDWLG